MFEQLVNMIYVLIAVGAVGLIMERLINDDNYPPCNP